MRRPFPSKENRKISERDDLGPPVGSRRTIPAHVLWCAGMVEPTIGSAGRVPHHPGDEASGPPFPRAILSCAGNNRLRRSCAPPSREAGRGPAFLASHPRRPWPSTEGCLEGSGGRFGIPKPSPKGKSPGQRQRPTGRAVSRERLGDWDGPLAV
jgi:hypothetical protein